MAEKKGRYNISKAKADAEAGRVSIRNARRDANSYLKELLKEKEITEDDLKRGEDQVQKLTDRYVAEVEKMLQEKEADLMKV